MKTIKKEVLPCPAKIPGPHSVVFSVNQDGLIDAGLGRGEVPIKLGASFVTTDERLLALLGIAKQIGAKRAFEIGTCSGATAANLYLSGMYVETIDLDEPLSVIRGIVNGEPVIVIPSGRLFVEGMGIPVKCHRGDTRTWQPNGSERTFDLVFVDGDHSYAMAKNDTELALRLMRPGGTIAWDDAAIDGLPKFLEEFERDHGEVTVVECGQVSNGRDWPIAFWTEPS